MLIICWRVKRQKSERLLDKWHMTKLLTAMPKHRLGCAVFTQKQIFGPRTAISQPIWIKFCTHLLLYGIHLCVDLDLNRLVGGSRPNQNDCFVILVMHHKSYIEMADCRDFGSKPSKWRWGWVLSWKIPELYSVCEPDPMKQHFSRF